MTPIVVVVVLLAVIALFLWVTYNGLVKLKIRVDEAWSDITIQLKRRADLIPNLVNTVKGYAKHEKTVFDDVTKARAATIEAKTPAEASKAEGDFQATMKSLFAVAEAYPALRASENFQQLSTELTDTEDKIQAARRFYNSGVRDLNTKIQLFPTNIFAGMLGFTQRDFFEVSEAEKKKIDEVVKVDFDK